MDIWATEYTEEHINIIFQKSPLAIFCVVELSLYRHMSQPEFFSIYRLCSSVTKR